jgi:hypothetical protein
LAPIPEAWYLSSWTALFIINTCLYL